MPLFDDVKDFFTVKNSDYYYNQLYPFQNAVLALAFSQPTSFYLSGGTALNRFILPLDNENLSRHSDDLDFFINLDDTQESLDYFHREKREIIKRVEQKYTVEAEQNLIFLSEYKVLSDNAFIYYAYNQKIKLKLQFVLDYRKKSSNLLLSNNNYRIDNLNNILTNKIATLKYREEFKDFVDLYYIAKFDKNIAWHHVITQTNQTSKVIGLTSKEFKKICKSLLELYRETDVETLTKKVMFGGTKESQKRQVLEILNGFEELVITRFL